jgi:hypothetical protein
MIVYLGMPRCASTWLYDNLKHIESNTSTVKETHHFYKDPIDLSDYCKTNVLDFSTNNWSMDSTVVKEIDPMVSNYILIIRDPIELTISYRSLFDISQPLDDFTYTLILNKILCYGDIIERWYNLVDPAKILIYRYSDLLANNEEFLLSITKKLQIPMVSTSDIMPKTNITNKYVQLMQQETTKLLQCKIILQQQIEKFEKITNIPTNFSINNLL